MSEGNGRCRLPQEPIVLTDEQVEEVRHLGKVLTQAQIADYLGFSERTFRNILSRDERVLAAYKTARAKANEQIASRLFQKALNGDTASMCFWLKCQAGWKETSRTEVTGADGGPLAVEQVSDAREEVAAEIARIRARITAGNGS